MEPIVSYFSAFGHRRPAAVNISTAGDFVNATAVGGLADAATTEGIRVNSSIKILCLEFINAYMDEFKDKREKYSEYLEVMVDIKQQRIGLTEVITRLEKLIEGHENLILGFNSFMPKKYKIKLTREQKPLDIQEAIILSNKLKDHFQSEGHLYNSLFDILNPRMRMNKSAAEVLPEVAALCGDIDLVEQFVCFLSLEAATTRTPEPTSHDGRSSAVPAERKPPQRKKMVKGCDSDTKLCLGIYLHGHEHVKMAGDREKETEGGDRSHQILESRSKDGNGYFHMKRKRDDRKSGDVTVIGRLHRHYSGNTITPSYRLSSSQHIRSTATHRTKLDASVLNDVCVSMLSSISEEEYNTKSVERKDLHERSQNEREDDLYELDMLLESVRKTIKQVEECFEKVSDKTIDAAIAFNKKIHLTVANRRCIEHVYGEYGMNVIDLLQDNSEDVLPVILTRLQQKEMEWKRYRENI